VYLWHLVLVNAMIHWDLASGWTGVGLTIVGAIAVGHLSCRFVETPALARKAKRRSDQQVAAASGRRLPGWPIPTVRRSS
jgi:peptidoglycan/LPS O-acetylase OafA/YrhL